jgi:polysaccharide chain length determinant protein (PEP-CTERM system associated)
MTLPAEQFVRVLINEAFHHRKAVVTLFVAINLVMLGLGLVWPKGFTASTTILVDEKNILQPLMLGAAVATEVTDRARLAREVIYGRKIMTQILEFGGWLKDAPTKAEQERMFEKLVKRTTIANLGKNIIKIEHKDDDPERAFRATQKMAELFIAESVGAKAAESQSAFEFIDKQVQEYHEKLMVAEGSLKEYRSANLDAQMGPGADIGTRLNALQTRVEQASQDLKEAEIKKLSLEKQLSGEAEIATVLSREGQFRARIGELQSQLDTLRLSYHETYPDIVRLRHQIADLNEEIARDRQRREATKAMGKTLVDDNIINNPMYQQLKRELSQTQVTIDMLRARINEGRNQMQQAIERGKRAHSGEATVAEVTRDYQVNRDIYQDLLKRRENARVSMNLDKERQGLTFKIQEPAVLPQTPSGLRFIHFVLGGLIFGALLPFGLLYGQLQVDPRIRVPVLIATRLKLPVLASVPQLWTPGEQRAARREMEWLGLAVSLTLTVVALISLLRLVKVV